MDHLNLEKFRRTARVDAPYPHVIVTGFLNPDSIRLINRTFPNITAGGSFPIDELAANCATREVIENLDGGDFEGAISEKFDIDLSAYPKSYSLRGYVRRRDGRIHTDSRDKIITVLLYLNEAWTERGGRLRILRSGTDLDDFTEEISPDNGTLLVFRRSDHSWHGHLPFEGQRRALQMNWMTGTTARGIHSLKHRISRFVKKKMANLA